MSLLTVSLLHRSPHQKKKKRKKRNKTPINPLVFMLTYLFSTCTTSVFSVRFALARVRLNAIPSLMLLQAKRVAKNKRRNVSEKERDSVCVCVSNYIPIVMLVFEHNLLVAHVQIGQ